MGLPLLRRGGAHARRPPPHRPRRERRGRAQAVERPGGDQHAEVAAEASAALARQRKARSWGYLAR